MHYALAVALCLSSATAHAAGFRFIDVPADAQGPAIKGAMWYPCAGTSGQTVVGPYLLPVVQDCPLPGDKHPLVVVSHGRTGTFLSQHDTAEALADAGFIVATLNHPGDTYSDKSRTGELSVYVERPTDIKRMVDFMVDASPAAPAIDPARIGFFGFSRGGYTGLVAIGGNPDWASASEFCRTSSAPACQQIVSKQYPTELLTHDTRIKAAVLADPLAPVFNAASLAAIKRPVQLWGSEFGGDGVLPHDVAAVDANLPAPHEFHLVRNAGHFAFFLCPPGLMEVDPDICSDRAGFDRVAFHKEFNAAVVAFLRDRLETAGD